MFRAAQPAQRRTDLQAPHAEVQMAPHRLVGLAVVAMTRRVRAARADQPAAAQRDRHDHPVGRKAHRSHPDTVQCQQTRECRADAHVVPPSVGRLTIRQPGSLPSRTAARRLRALHGVAARGRPLKSAATRLATRGPGGPLLTARPRFADSRSHRLRCAQTAPCRACPTYTARTSAKKRCSAAQSTTPVTYDHPRSPKDRRCEQPQQGA